VFGKNYIELSSNIFIYKNFISESECKTLYNFCIALSETDWNFKSKHEWFDGKVSIPTDELLFLYKRISDLVYPQYKMLPSLNLRRLKEGQDMYLHTDSLQDNKNVSYNSKNYTIEYGIVAYINDDYSGGELYYPNKNLEYKPSAGDLVIHGSHKDCEHGVKKVITGNRYCYSNFLFPQSAGGVFNTVLYKEQKEIMEKLKRYN
jgi:hypothetical protein